jgi:hypothetical protein
MRQDTCKTFVSLSGESATTEHMAAAEGGQPPVRGESVLCPVFGPWGATAIRKPQCTVLDPYILLQL